MTFCGIGKLSRIGHLLEAEIKKSIFSRIHDKWEIKRTEFCFAFFSVFRNSFIVKSLSFNWHITTHTHPGAHICARNGHKYFFSLSLSPSRHCAAYCSNVSRARQVFVCVREEAFLYFHLFYFYPLRALRPCVSPYCICERVYLGFGCPLSNVA